MSTANDRCIQRPYKATTDTSGDRELWYVSVPAVDYIREAFFGAISTLGFPESYNPISDVAAEYGSEIGASLTQIVPPEEVTVPGQMSRAELWAIDAENIGVSSGLTFALSTAWMYNYGTVCVAPASGNFYRMPLNLQPGSWKMNTLVHRSTDRGILQLQYVVPGGAITTFGTIDLWYFTSSFNIIVTTTFTVPAGGIEYFRFGTSSKNASSSGYQLAIGNFSLWRTGP